MPTDKPRVTITMSEETLEKVDDFRYKNRIKTQSKAIVQLMIAGLEDMERQGIIKKVTPSISDEAAKLVKDYESLDYWGKRTVRSTMDLELERKKDEDQNREMDDYIQSVSSKVIPLFLIPSAASYASPLYGEDYEDYTLTDDDPPSASFAIRVQGDSMEPYIHDGSIAFCNRDPLADGDIGVFCVDGESYIKQYHHDALGITYLFSLNRKRADMDIVLPSSTGRSVACLGRVITNRKYPVPGLR